jgi:hypothetical protein
MESTGNIFLSLYCYWRRRPAPVLSSSDTMQCRQERGSTSASRSTGGEVSILAYSAVQRCGGGGLMAGGGMLTAGCGYRAVQAGARVVASTVATAGWDHGGGV